MSRATKTMKTFKITNFLLIISSVLLITSCDLDTVDPTSPFAGKLKSVKYVIQPLVEGGRTEITWNIDYDTTTANTKTKMYLSTEPSKKYTLADCLKPQQNCHDTDTLIPIANGYQWVMTDGGSAGYFVNQTVENTSVSGKAGIRNKLDAKYLIGLYSEIETVSEDFTIYAPSENKVAVLFNSGNTGIYSFTTLASDVNAERIKIANAFLLSTLTVSNTASRIFGKSGCIGGVLNMGLVPTMAIGLVDIPLYALDPIELSNSSAYIPSGAITGITYPNGKEVGVQYLQANDVVQSFTYEDEAAAQQISVIFEWY